MLERDGYPAGVPCWVDMFGPDPRAAVAFYEGVFGWEFADMTPEGSSAEYYIARLGGGDVAGVGTPPPGAPASAVWNTYVSVDSAEDTAAKVRATGGRVVEDPVDVLDQGRMAAFTDPDGAAFCVWEPKKHKGAQVVNLPGSLNFNGLNTRDVDGAKAFYGSVFGWETLALPGGAIAWRLPGYGDHLEERDPGLRQRIAESGGPVGFEDVVATLSPITDDQQPSWTVTFAVEDADAIAEQVTRLGGRVLVAPFDAPWVRMTVVADPQGATFIASKFVPENR